MNKSSYFIVGKHPVIDALKNNNRKVLKVFLTEESKKTIHRENTNKNLLNDDNAVQTLIIGKVKSATKSRFRIRPKVHAHIIRIAG